MLIVHAKISVIVFKLVVKKRSALMFTSICRFFVNRATNSESISSEAKEYHK
jgi:hypothetical protein